MSVLYEDGVGGTLITMVQFWIDLRNPLVCEGLCFNMCFLAASIQQYQHWNPIGQTHSPPCSWFLFIQSGVSVETEAWSSTRLQDASFPFSPLPFSFLSILYLSSPPGSLPDSAEPSAFTADTHNLCLSIFILPFWYTHLSRILSLITVFPIYLLFLSVSLSILSSLPALWGNSSFCEAFINRSCWRVKSDGHLKAGLK